MKNHKKKLITAIKVLITLLPIYLILKNIDIDTTLGLIANIDLPTYFLRWLFC